MSNRQQQTGPYSGQARQGAAQAAEPTATHPLDDMNWQSFVSDGIEFERSQVTAGGPTLAAGDPMGKASDSGLDGLQRLSSAEIDKILNMDTSALDLSNPLPNVFGGEDGNDLLSLDFPELMCPADGFRAALQQAQQAVAHQPRQELPPARQAAAASGEVGSEADAARSVLAALGSPTSSPGQGHNALAHSRAPSAAASERPPPQQAPPQDQRSYSPPPGYVLAGAPVFVDAATGQIIHHSGSYMAQPWGGPPPQQQMQPVPGQPLPQYYGHPQQYHPHQVQYHPHQVQYIIQQHPPGSPSMHLAYAPGVVLAAAHAPQPPAQDPPSPKKSPPKRRRASKTTANTETVAQQCAKAEQGYTFDPASSRLYRHGPALMASAKDNKELPVVKSLFDTFHQHHGFSSPPPPGYLQPQQGQRSGAGTSMQLPVLSQGAPCGGLLEQHGGQQGNQPYLLPHNPHHQQQGYLPPQPLMVPQGPGQQQQRSSSPLPSNSPGPSTSSSHLLNPEPAAAGAAPGGRHLNPRTGHGFITSLVTRELQSSTPPPPPGSGPAGSEDGSGGRMVGVARDKWSLFWDAFVEPASPEASPRGPAPGSILQGFRQEALHLGKFPTRDQAGRAHDIAALKLHGDAAVTNFPREAYAATLPVLAVHSGEEVVAALKKDSELALHRTSRYKGVRRTGGGQFEARAEVDEILGPEAAAAAAAAVAAATHGLAE